jgi:hypothetical protein
MESPPCTPSPHRLVLTLHLLELPQEQIGGNDRRIPLGGSGAACHAGSCIGVDVGVRCRETVTERL